MAGKAFCAMISLAVMLAACLPAGASSFKVMAFHLDMRAEVMTTEALHALAEDLAGKGINTIIMEWEAAFPFSRHATLCSPSAYTEDEVREFVSCCSGLGIDVIPLQHCFGHCEYILRHDRYRGLREDVKDPSQVCPLRIEKASEVFSEIFAEVAALHPSGYFHIGCDETYLLGKCGQCAKAVQEYGKSRLFADYVRAMCGIVSDMGKTPVIWADIILQHPEAIGELPENLVYVDWNYGWEPDRFGKLENLHGKNVRMWGASSLRSGPDNWYLTQWMKHFMNIADFVPFARSRGYEGIVQTSWSTSGTYGYYLDSGYEVLDMQPVRLVYPMSGFRILQDAFCQAVSSDAPFDPEDFVKHYAVDTMGLGSDGAAVLWRYFSMPQEQILVSGNGACDASGRPLEEVLGECLSVRNELAGLVPERRKSYLEHWLLMLDMRINYLKYKSVEARFQSDGYCRAQSAELSAELEDIILREDALAVRFEKLQKGYLKDSEIEYVNYIKSLKMKDLYRRIANNAK